MESAHGAIALRWEPLTPAAARLVSRAHAVVVLRPLTPDDEPELWRGAFDHDAIRFPVAPQTGCATVFAPPDRVVTVGLAFRDARGRPLSAPPIEVSAPANHCDVPAPETPNAPAPRAERTPTPPPATLAPPPLPTPSAAPRAADVPRAPQARPPVEMVFAQPPGGPPPPDLATLARRVATQLAGEPPVTRPPRPPGGSFGARGRWYPVHLMWPAPASPPYEPLRLVTRARFMDAQAVAAWASAPPADAVPLPDGADGLIDATVPEGEVRFYVVLAGPAPWRALPLSPAPPPFARPRRPASLGDVPGSLAAAVHARLGHLQATPTSGSDLSVQLELLGALTRRCEGPARDDLLAAIEALRGGPLF